MIYKDIFFQFFKKLIKYIINKLMKKVYNCLITKSGDKYGKAFNYYGLVPDIFENSDRVIIKNVKDCEYEVVVFKRKKFYPKIYNILKDEYNKMMEYIDTNLNQNNMIINKNEKINEKDIYNLIDNFDMIIEIRNLF